MNIFEKATKIAKKLPDQKYKLVAIITDKRDNILSVGMNSYKKSHPTQAYYSEKVGNGHQIYLHAELDAIIKLKYTDKPYAIHIVRVNNKGETLLAKPCPICKRAIKDVGIKEIYHT